MSSNTINEDRESTTNEDDAVPSTSLAAVKKVHNDETTCDASEQSNQKKTKTSDKEQKSTNVIGTGEEYTGEGMKKTFHGFSYQMKLPMVYIVRGLKQGCAFQVATEVEAADKFDDLLFLYDKDEIGFFQAKHKFTEEIKITEEQLLSAEGDFSITKYFHSYDKILNEKQLENVIKNKNIVFILNTNIGINESVLEKNFEPVTASSTLSDNKILALGAEEERKNYYLVKKESDLYVELLKKLEQPTRLAEHLATAVANNNKKSIQTNDFFDRHRDWLLANVLEVGKEDINTQTRYFVTFKESFLTGSEQNVLNFRRIFYKTYLRQIEKDDPTSVQKDLTDVKFQVPRRFASPKNSKTKSVKGEMRTFLDGLVFAVKQPNENELRDVIEKEIDDYVGHKDRQSIASKFILYIQDWAKQREGRYLTNEDVERQFAAWGYETLNQIRMEDVEKYKCAYKESNNVIENLSNFLNVSNDAHTMHDVLCLYCRETLFSKIKVFQVFKTCFRENTDQQFIFCDLRDLIENKNTKMCPVKAFSSQTCNTLFVSLQDCQLNNAEVNILRRLLQVAIERNRIARQPLSNKQRKRLIISIPESLKSEFIEKICFNKQDIENLSLDDFSNSYSDLDEKSKQQLMENGSIKLHGTSITGLLSEKEMDLYIRDELLLKFISNELEINDAIEERNPYSKEINEYYINRSLLPVIVDQDIEKDTLFHLVREHTQHGDIRNQEVVVVSSDEKLFDHFRKIYGNVHWLKETNNKFFWITSQGTLTNLRKYVAKQDPGLDLDWDPQMCIPVTNISDVKKDVVLISASPGMGKSILLSHIAEQSKKEDNSFVVFKTNLTDTIDKLESLKKDGKVTLEQAIHFLFICTQVESSQTEESESAFNLLTVQKDGSIAFSPKARFRPLELLRAMVFCNLYNKGKIVLLLDGFDEIAPDYCKTTLKLLQTLKHSQVHKMWVTTRPYAVTKDLEHYLETFAYTLKPLSKHEHLQFFENFWKHKIKSRTEVQSFLKDFLESLEMNTFSILDDTDRQQNPNKSIESFMGVPLHCYMLAKVLTKDFTEFCSQNINDAPAITSITNFYLYSKFFDIKFDEILHNENLKNPKNEPLRLQKKIAESNHGKLALLQIFDKELLTQVVPDEDRITLINSVKSGNEKTGIVTEVVGNKPQFVHRTFAEYFAAHHLAEVLMSPDENKRKEAARLLLYNSVTMNLEHYYVLFIFFNYSVVSRSKYKEIFEAAISGNIQRLSEAEYVNEIFDPLNRTPMHLIAINLFYGIDRFLRLYVQADLKTTATMHNYFLNFIRQLCQSMSKCSPDALFRWTPAHYMTISFFGASASLKMIPFLLNYLNDVTPDALYRTPLMLLMLSNPASLDKFTDYALLNWTDVNTQDNFGKTALHYLLETYTRTTAYNKLRNFEQELSGVCLLLKLGARIDIPDNRGKTSEDLLNLLFVELTEYNWKELAFNLLLDARTYNIDDIFQTNWKHINHVNEYLCTSEGHDVVFSFKTDPNYEKIESVGIESVLKYLLLRQLHTNNMTPILPVLDDDVIALYYMEIYQVANYHIEKIIAKTDIFTLSNLNDDQRNKIIFLLTETRHIASILLSNSPDLVDIVDSRGRSALHYAIHKRDYSRVTHLIKSNARVDILDNAGKMPAHIEKSNILLECDYTFDKEKLNFIDTLTIEIAEPLVLTMNLYPIRTQIDADFIVHVLGNTECIAQVLLSQYSEAVHMKDSKGRTALHYAVQNKYEPCVTFLIKRKAIVNVPDNDGKMPAHIEKSNILLECDTFDKEKLNFINTLTLEVAHPLVSTMNLYPIQSPIDADFIVHILHRTTTIAHILLSHYPEAVDTKDSKGRTALHYAIEKQDATSVCYLIAKNAQVDIADNGGKCPAHLDELDDVANICKLSFIDTLPFVVAKRLVLTMALVPPVTQFRDELLKYIFDECRTIASILWAEYSNLIVKHNCSYFDSSNVSNEIVTRLLDIYCIEDFSDNILKSNEILKLVVELFSSVKSNDLSRVQTVLKRVETYNPTKCKFLTRKSNVPKNLVFRCNFQPGRFLPYNRRMFPGLKSTISILRDETNVATLVINARSKDGGKTALHYAAEIGNADIVDALLSHGAYYNVPDFLGSTPSQIAKTRAYSAVLHLLERVEELFNRLNHYYFYDYGTGKYDNLWIRWVHPYVNPREYFIQKDEPETIEDTFVGIYVIQNLGAEFAENSSDDDNSLIVKIHKVMNID